MRKIEFLILDSCINILFLRRFFEIENRSNVIIEI